MLDHRLTTVEGELVGLTKAVASLTTDVAVLQRTVATKEDVARIDATLLSLQQNCATKADVAQLEARMLKWMIATLITVGGMNATLVLMVVKLLHV
nr:hypothetical protein [uncultured Duganella sp.]